MSSGNRKYVFTQALAPSGEGEVEGSLWYDTNTNTLETYTGSAWTPVASAPGAGGHTVIAVQGYSAVVQGTWLFGGNTSYRYLNYLYNHSNAINDEINYKIFLAPGTYTFWGVGYTSGGMGKSHIEIDGTDVGNFDWYGGATFNVLKTITGVTVAAGGLKTLAVKMSSKNGSSSGYELNLNIFGVFRTA